MEAKKERISERVEVVCLFLLWDFLNVMIDPWDNFS